MEDGKDSGVLAPCQADDRLGSRGVVLIVEPIHQRLPQLGRVYLLDHRAQAEGRPVADVGRRVTAQKDQTGNRSIMLMRQ